MQDGVTRWALKMMTYLSHHVTSSTHFVVLKGNSFKLMIYSLSLCRTLYLRSVLRA